MRQQKAGTTWGLQEYKENRRWRDGADLPKERKPGHQMATAFPQTPKQSGEKPQVGLEEGMCSLHQEAGNE
ncbi:unnamed protein product [Gulo gulo]|uniref:Uncharacterized protein n=1 Tax=Gulo gulo TaxID=48420 RepID=A0A9X9M2X1_GULGU|nr:unnamed protein product [Gulo gulo]